MVVLKSLAACAAAVFATLGAAGVAGAHVSLSPGTATAGAYQVLRFGVGHGCDGKATTALRIAIPAGVQVAHPQPKPGWRLTIEHPPSRPEAAAAITWTGRLPADQFDEFVVLTKLPTDETALAFPATQSCGAIVIHWSEPAAADGPRPQHPAPSLKLTPPAPSPDASHEHHH